MSWIWMNAAFMSCYYIALGWLIGEMMSLDKWLGIALLIIGLAASFAGGIYLGAYYSKRGKL